MSKTPPERSKCGITHPYEREAIVLLSRAGWTHSELAMTFLISEAAVVRLLEAEGVA